MISKFVICPVLLLGLFTCSLALNITGDFIIVSSVNTPGIFFSNIDHANLEDVAFQQLSIVPSPEFPTSVDYNTRAFDIYWADQYQGTIWKYSLSKNYTEAVVSDLSNASLAVDRPGRQLFWTDASMNVIEKMNINGDNRQVVVSDVHEPLSIMLDVSRGHMYWSSGGTDPTIKRADIIDGSNVTTLVNTNLSRPVTLALDAGLNRLYWGDVGNENVAFLDMSTGYRQELILIVQAVTLQIYNTYLYWTDLDKDQIYRADKTTGEDIVAFSEDDDIIPYSLYISRFNREEITGDFIIVSSVTTPGIFFSYIDHDNLEDVAFQQLGVFPSPEFPTSVDYTPRTFDIFWADQYNGTIWRYSLTEEYTEAVVLNLANVSLAVDRPDRKLFWTDASRNVIERMKFNGNGRQVLINGVDDPLSITLDVPQGHFYWSAGGIVPIIERADMKNGGNRVILVDTDLIRPVTLAVDSNLKRLYWGDAGNENIAFLDLSTGNRQEVIVGVRVVSVQIYDIYLYWTDLNQDQIFRADKNTGENVEAFSEDDDIIPYSLYISKYEDEGKYHSL
ncbi:low-density lipoprotein receptor-related protein 4-like [Anneissia japonica]|uniref:low-density lipoprotein receptor-related protein 4-like n=1 Tax=Anneissia japonica TaxID=1529436 RepID=UPI0014257EE4|nr:low-density lipoprotein receptor-related protein 4-like [Anneissia japonica]